MKNLWQNLGTSFFPFLSRLTAWVLVAMVGLGVWLGHPEHALAKRGSGSMGGSSFRRSPVTRSNPVRRSSPSVGRSSRTNVYNNYNSYYSPAPWVPFWGGGSFFFLPSFGFGGGLLSLLVLMAIAGSVLQFFRGQGITTGEEQVTVAKVQVGLLASARSLQADLNRLSELADTNTNSGLALLLRETTLSVARHPEYWAYVSSAKEEAPFSQAESCFNRLTMTERSKLTAEVISNRDGIRRQAQGNGVLVSSDLDDPSEYIVVTIMAASSRLSLRSLPAKVRTAEELRQSLSVLGAIANDDLLAVEVLWEPQSTAYTLTATELLTVYPDLLHV
ncbi:MAG: DUF1517 domain-containing protein [Oscillatoriales cyanobacterium SM2_2_1]|nr:DUF1517 domain-containing protein [Oscillatoriales cyanobacterium SM2_2_1]